MLTQKHIEHFRAFGFVVLRDHLDPATVAALSDEVDRVLRDAFGARFDERDETGGGITGHYLPVNGPRAPVSRALVEDDRLHGVAEQLLGAQALPWYPEAILFFGEAGLHSDVGTGVVGLKLACYLEPLTAENGALRLLPGSHHPDYGAAMRRFQRRNRAANQAELREQIETMPLFVAETRPGDVIAFYLHTYHASIYGTDRRQWQATYFKDPETPEERAAFDRTVAADRDWIAEEAPKYDRQRIRSSIRTGSSGKTTRPVPGSSRGWGSSASSTARGNSERDRSGDEEECDNGRTRMSET